MAFVNMKCRCEMSYNFSGSTCFLYFRKPYNYAYEDTSDEG